MIASLMIYACIVALAISVAAYAIERGFAALGWQGRSIWMAALLASLALPTFMLATARPIAIKNTSLPEIASATLADTSAGPSMNSDAATTDIEPVPVTIRSFPSTAVADEVRVWTFEWPLLASFDTFLKSLWIAASASLLVVYLIGWLRLRRLAESWISQDVDRETVLVTDQMGPAVLGFIKPRIVLPRWLLDTSSTTREMVLAHEREHIRAGDPFYLAFGLLLVAIAPWNPFLWWQLRRLRFAIEVDCDARVLRRGNDAATYGEMLLSVSQRNASLPLGAMAMTEPTSQLERRVRIMMSNNKQRAKLLIAASVALSASCIVGAAQINAPVIKIAAAQAEQEKTSAPILAAAANTQPAARQENSGEKDKTSALKPAGNRAISQGSKKQYVGAPANFDFDDADVRTILKTLGGTSGQNMIVTESVNGTMTLHFKNAPWDEVLDAMMLAKGLAMHKQGNIMFIGTVAEIAAHRQAIAQSTLAAAQKPAEKRYTGARINLDFQDVEVRAILKVLGDISGQNLVVNDSVKGSFTLRLKDVPWDQALDIVLQSKRLAMRRVGSTLIIGTADELAALRKTAASEAAAQATGAQLDGPRRTETIQLRNANAGKTLAALLPQLETLDRKATISMDEKANAITITTTSDILWLMNAKIRQLDSPDAAQPARRAREFLEQFPLQSLHLVGTVDVEGKKYALVRDPSGLVHQISAGNYVGQQNGKINSITDSQISIVAVLPDGKGGYLEQAQVLTLDNSAPPSQFTQTNPTPNWRAPPLPVATSPLKRTKFVEPVFPPEARSQGLSGWVEVAFTIASNGDVEDASVRASSPTDAFDEAALTAVRQWKYQPPMKDGEPMSQRSAVRLKF